MFEENNSPEREAAPSSPAPTPPPSYNTNQQRTPQNYQNTYYQQYQRPAESAYKPAVNSSPANPSGHGADTKSKKQSPLGAGKLIGILAIVAVVAVLVGGVGGYLTANYKLSRKNGASNSAGSSTIVVYQSTENGSSSPVLSSGSTISEIAKKVAPSVVEIATEVAQGGGFMSQYITKGAGSGVIISKDGYIVTNNHVIEKAKKITVILNNGESYNATLIGTDELTDIAVIKIEESGLTPAVYGSSDALQVGDFALAVGNPLGKLGGTVTNGIISALEREVSIDSVKMTLLQTNAAINPGNSGGGLFNASGELIGIVNAKAAGEDIEGLGFAIPIDIAKPVIQDIISYGYVTGRVQAGIQILDVLDYETAFQYRVSKLGPYIYTVFEGSDAERAGLKQGDLITHINDNLVYESEDIISIIADCEVGDTLTFTVERDGKELKIDVTFTEHKPQ